MSARISTIHGFGQVVKLFVESAKNRDGWRVATIAAQLDICVPTVRRYLAMLLALGLIRPAYGFSGRGITYEWAP